MRALQNVLWIGHPYSWTLRVGGCCTYLYAELGWLKFRLPKRRR